ncbi:MAG: hypothetical protein ABI789_11240 [Usitatibacter sp.]
MTPESFLNGFAQEVVEQSFDRAERMLAPWVRSGLPVGGLKRVVRIARGDNPPAAEFELGELPDDELPSMRQRVEARTISDGDGPPSLPIPAELTEENFRGCWQIEFLPDEDSEADVDFSFAFYLALVADGQELRVGYLESID